MRLSVINKRYLIFDFDLTIRNTCTKLSVVYCVQSEGSGRGSGYQGLNPADMEPIQVPPPPDHYAGLGVQAPGAGLDPHGYIEVLPDPEYDDHPQVCMEFSGDLLIMKYRECL